MNRKDHWEKIYTTKLPHEVSWTQDVPKTSLSLISELNLDPSVSIIDIGGGDGNFVDHLLELGYQNITVLDISEAAIERAKSRLGSKAKNVKWIVSDILEFKPNQMYNLWHDRAVFHFLTSEVEIDSYKQLVSANATNIVLGTFATDGPLKCSGLAISQYNEEKIRETFSPPYRISKFVTQIHKTPFETTQNFVFALLKRELQ
ncbi:MAG: class I SAM-dependent methyltransferase [Bacteroidia bacterium]|nr:class I SAM-dependent methyltransferase [Bacteroidia bacterium]NNJ56473.1 class I SAM-dependent methyltransferase [Bacteroidia bacterium]